MQRVLFNLHRKLLPTNVLQEKASEYLAADLISSEMAARVMECIKQERGTTTYLNDGVSEVPEDGVVEQTTQLSPAAMKVLLNKRVNMMQDGARAGEGDTDQFRVYQYIIHCIEHGEFLRVMVQASAGTGKSFLLNTVFLWCLVKGKRVKAAAPTGIAAANIEIERTSVRATTIHQMFEFDNEFKTKIDFTKQTQSVVELLNLEVLLLDEVSMIDERCYSGICDVLSIMDHTRRPTERASADCFGPMHVLLFGDFKRSIGIVKLCVWWPRGRVGSSASKIFMCVFVCSARQLPPATSRAPFIVHPRVTGDFQFRCLRENRRVVQEDSRRDELEVFHKVLTDISQGADSNDVRSFIIDAYVRGYKIGCAENVEFEGSTAVFTRRRYRDK